MKSSDVWLTNASFALISIILLAVVILATSCGGGGSTQINPPTNRNNDNNNNDNGGTIPPDGGGDNGGTTPPPVAPSVKGTIDVSGIPVADESGLPADVTRTTLKVIDPSEEIGDSTAVAPSPTGTYEIVDLTPANVSYLNISFNTAVDLKGIGQTITPVSVNLPIQLADNVVTTIDTSVAVYTPKVTAANKSGSDGDDDDIDDDKPGNDDTGGNGDDDDGETSGAIEISYSYQGPDGTRNGRFIIDYRANQTIYDLDYDGNYNDDAPHLDGDNDGIRDDRNDDDRYREQFIEVEVVGSVESIGTDFLRVRGITFIVDERTNYRNCFNLSQIAVGDSVKVDGYQTPAGNIYAKEIELE